MSFGARFDRPLAMGESVAVNGACLTVVNLLSDAFEADVSPETLEKTNLGDLRPGDPVNLERALTLSQPLGGHLVSGHVDAVGRLVRLVPEGEYFRLEVESTPEVVRYTIPKGSIAIDGISLTVNTVEGNRLGTMIIPHTLHATNLACRRVGDRVNMEADLIGKYVERLLGVWGPFGGLTMEKLAEAGYLKDSSGR